MKKNTQPERIWIRSETALLIKKHKLQNETKAMTLQKLLLPLLKKEGLL